MSERARLERPGAGLRRGCGWPNFSATILFTPQKLCTHIIVFS